MRLIGSCAFASTSWAVAAACVPATRVRLDEREPRTGVVRPHVVLVGEGDVLDGGTAPSRSSSYISPRPVPSMLSAGADPEPEAVLAGELEALRARCPIPRSMSPAMTRDVPIDVEAVGEGLQVAELLGERRPPSLPTRRPSALSRFSIRTYACVAYAQPELGARLQRLEHGRSPHRLAVLGLGVSTGRDAAPW